MKMKDEKLNNSVIPSADGRPLAKADESESLFSGLPQEIMEKLSPAKTRMILLWLTGQYTQKKIGQVVGVTENTVRTWLCDPMIQAVIKEIQGREFAVIESNLKAMSFKALDTMNQLLDSDMDNVRYSAAKDILDRGGHKPQQSIRVDKTVTTIEQQMRELADFTIDDDEVIDIDIEELKEL